MVAMCIYLYFHLREYFTSIYVNFLHFRYNHSKSLTSLPGCNKFFDSNISAVKMHKKNLNNKMFLKKQIKSQ